MNGDGAERKRCVLAVAGRRIDALKAVRARFPLDQADRVSAELRELLISSRVVAVVASAANGADLLALQAAGDLGLRRIVVLPCAARAFQSSSVTDRPGDWGPLYTRVIDEVRAGGSLIELDFSLDADGYRKVTDRLIAWTAEMVDSEGLRGAAAVVWEGACRGPEDMTAYFRDRAVERGFDVHEIRTAP